MEWDDVEGALLSILSLICLTFSDIQRNHIHPEICMGLRIKVNKTRPINTERTTKRHRALGNVSSQSITFHCYKSFENVLHH